MQKPKTLHQLLDLVGNTPLVPLNHIGSEFKSKIFVKLEFTNPSGSVKDRMAKYILDYAKMNDLIGPGSTIVENSSGNTGTALAMMCAIRGYSCIITMPDKMSNEKKYLMQAFGAKVIVTPTDVPHDSAESYYSVAKKLSQSIPNAYYPDQYNNPLNIEAHYKLTGPEIWEQTEGKIDILVAGVGTGGTLSGVGRFLKERNPNIQIVAVDPLGSVFYNYFKYKTLTKPHVYKVEGIGEDYLVKALDFSVIDDMIQTQDKESFLMARRVSREEGLFSGGSSGAAIWAALEVAKQLKQPKNIVVILPDSGDRYLSKFYNDDWMKQQGYQS